MLSLHTNYQFGSYQLDRLALLQGLENATLRDNPTLVSQLKPKWDRKDSLDIGYGFDLLTHSNADIARLLAAAGLSYQNVGWGSPDVKTTDLNLLDIYRGARSSGLLGKANKQFWDNRADKLSLQLPSELAARALLNAEADEKETLLTQSLATRGLILGESNERLALLSMVFNGGLGIFGSSLSQSKLLNALETGNRAEAWFEIRYNTNAESKRTDAASQAVTEGIADRRINESNLFGLYNEQGPGIPEDEAKDVLRMYTIHRNDIQTYENQFHSLFLVAGANTIQSQLTAAKGPLLALYADGQTIDGDVLVGADLLLGTAKADLIFGEKGDDILVGNDGNDILRGGEGNDELFGGPGNDVLKGGAGKDTYFYSSGDGSDVIVDTPLILDGGGQPEGDGKGAIVYDEHVLGGGIHHTTDAANTFASTDGQFTFVKSGNDLLVTSTSDTTGGSITIKDFTNGDLGITLANAPEIVTDFGPATRTEFQKVDHFVQVGTDLNGNPIFEPVFANFFDDASNDTRTTSDPGRLTPPIGDNNNLIHAGGGSDFIASGAGDDQLFGDAGSDTIFAGAGDDRLSGGTDGDFLDGGPGSDTLSGDEGDDTVYGGAGNDSLVGGPGNDFMNGDDPNDPVGVTGNDVLDGGDGNDVLQGGAGNDVLMGGAGNDHMEGDFALNFNATGNDFLDGGAGNDSVQGGGGNDVLLGGAGDDLLQGDGPNNPAIPWDSSVDGNDVLDGGAGNDELQGGGGDDILVGGAGDDLLFGDDTFPVTETGNDLLDGGAGNDQLQGMGGDDVLFGRDGNDTLFGDDPNRPDRAGGNDFLDGGEGNDILTGQGGNDILAGGSGDDTLRGDSFLRPNGLGGFTEIQAPNPGNDLLDGEAGNDFLEGDAGDDALVGGTGSDTLYGDSSTDPGVTGNDSLDGGEGDDQLFGGGGDDVLTGDAGNDLLSGDDLNSTNLFGVQVFTASNAPGSDQLDGGEGDDRLFGGGGDDTLTGGAGNDYLLGDDFPGIDLFGNSIFFPSSTPGDDLLDGGDGDDQLFGRGGNDVLLGGDGNDLLDGGVGNDSLDGGAGDDTLTGGAGDDVLVGGAGNDVLTDESGNNLLDGGDGNDILTVSDIGNNTLLGGAGDDRLTGGQGNDVLDGGSGNDILTGSGGNDTYVFGRGYGRDTVNNIFGSGGTIQINADTAPGDVTVTRVRDLTRGIDDLVLRIKGTTDRLTVSNFFLDPIFQVQQVLFADGTTWDVPTLQDFARRVPDPDPGPSSLIGFDDSDDIIRAFGPGNVLMGLGGNDLLDGRDGNDTMYGGRGSDTYIFGRGAGRAQVFDFAQAGSGDLNTIQMADVTPDDVTVLASPEHLVLALNNPDGTPGMADRLALAYFNMDEAFRAVQVQFADGTVWDAGTLRALVSGTLSDADSVSVPSRPPSGDGGGGTSGSGGTGVGTTGPTETPVLVGGPGDDLLGGGPGDDTLIGGAGNDTYLFGRGSGHDTIVEDDATAGNVDTVQFSADVAPSDVAVTGSGDDLVLSINGSTDQLTVQAFFLDAAHQIEQVSFDDGTVWDIATIEDHLPKTLTGTSGADTLYGGAGPDTFDGGAGNDTMYGYDGNDTYLFGPGSGQDTVLDFDPTAGNVDTIEMASGVAPSDVTVTHQQDLAAGVDDLVLSINGTSDQLTVQSFFTDPVFHVERVAFADGTVWDATELRDKTLRLWQGGPDTDFIIVPIFGFESNDNLVDGGAGDDFLETSIGNNVLRGDEGDDRLFAGNGADELDGGPGDDLLQGDGGFVGFVGAPGRNDTLLGGDGNDTLNGAGGDDLLDGGAGDDFLSGDGGLFRGIFGNLVSEATNPGNDTLLGGEGTDTLFGGPGDDLLDGGAGNDLLAGGPGNDTYLFGRGSGQDTIDTISDSGNFGTEVNVIQIAAGVLPGDIEVKAEVDLSRGLPSGDNLVLSLEGTTDQLTLQGFFLDPFVQTYSVQFADGTTWDVATLKEKTRFITGTDGPDFLHGHELNDVITGLGGDDILDGGLGEDTLIGGPGDDTYMVDDPLDQVIEAPGEGTDAVRSSVNYMLPDNVEDLTLLDSARLGFSDFGDPQLSERATFGIGNALDNVLTGNTADNVLDGGAGNDTLIGGIEGFQGEGGFIPGSGNDILIGGAGNDILEGVDGNDTLVGGPGNDLLIGGTGDDTYSFNLGDGDDTIDDGNLGGYVGIGSSAGGGGGGNNTVVFGDGITSDSISLSLDQESLLTVRYGHQGDAIHMENFDPNDSFGPHDIETFQFADGTVLTYADLIGRGFDLTGTAADDFITGTNVVDRISGLAGNDTLVGGQGDDILTGGAGNDTYLFNLGDGVDTIHDTATPGEGNSIQFGAGITAANLTFTQDQAAHTLTIVYDDAVQLVDFDPNNVDGTLVVSTLSFFDGSSLNMADLFPPTNVNHVPSVSNPIADQSTPEDAPFSFVVPANTFADQDAGDTLTLSASLASGDPLPAWLSFDGATGTFSGTPDDPDNGTVSLKVTATDTGHLSVATTFGLTVTPVNDAPTVANPIANQSAEAESPFSFVVPGNTFADQDVGDTLTYNAALAGGGALPAWLSFDGTTRALSGTPGDGDVGNLSLQVTATDSGGLSVAGTFGLTVTPPPNLVVVGTPGDDVITTRGGNDVIDAKGGNDTVNAGKGNDTITGGPGNDILNGGPGNDTYVYNLGDGLDQITDPSGVDAVSFGAGISFDNTVARLTTAAGLTTAHLRLLDAGGCEQPDQGLDFALDPGGISPIEQFAFSNGTRLSLSDLVIQTKVTFGTNHDDVIRTGREDDVIYSLNGKDTVFAGSGNDTVYAGNGSDTVYGEGGNDTLYGGNGKDLLDGGYGDDLLVGGNGKDTLIGGWGNDTLRGGDGDDTLQGGPGNDVLDTGKGDDTILFGRGDGHDSLIGRENNQDDDIQFGPGIAIQHVWFTKSGNDLTVSVLDTHGPSDQINIVDWYADKKNHVDEFKTANGDELDEKRVEQLRQAMAAFAPPALSADMTLPSDIQRQLAPALAAAWEHGHD